MEDFNDLFNRFFGKNDDDNNENEDNNKDGELSDRAKKIIDMIESFKNINANGIYSGEALEKLDSELDDKLGTPDKVVYSKDGNMYIQKRMWFKPHGIIVKTVMSDVPFENQEEEVEEKLTLEEQLSLAVENEDYELAASLRDQIKKLKAKEKRLERKRLKELEK